MPMVCHRSSLPEVDAMLAPHPTRIRLDQVRFLREAEKIGWRSAVPKGRHESSPGRQVLGRVGRTGVESRQGRLRACLRSPAKDLLPEKIARLDSVVPFGTAFVVRTSTPHFVRGYLQPSRPMPGLITAAVTGTICTLNIPLPDQQPGLAMQGSASVCRTKSKDTIPLIH